MIAKEKGVEDITDEDIITLYWQRDSNAIEATSRAYGTYCYAIANGILKSPEDAEECVNDTWMRAWSTIPPQRPRNLRIFLAKITRNLAFDKFKSRHTQKRGGGEICLALEELAECIDAGSDLESTIMAKELEQSINSFLYGLPKRDRDIFLRRYFFVESTDDIAARYGTTRGAVLMALSRTRQKLKLYLKKEGLI